MARKKNIVTVVLIGLAGIFGAGFLRRRRRRSIVAQVATPPSPFSPGGELTVFATGSDVGFAVWLTRNLETEVVVADLTELFDVTIIALGGSNLDDVGRFADKLQDAGVSVSVVAPTPQRTRR